MSVEQGQIRGVYVYRDPRDVCVSYYHYLMRLPNHWCYEYFADVLADDSERLKATITGVDDRLPDGRSAHLESIDYVFRSRMGYMEDPCFCSVSFEELIGARGGGNDAEQKLTIRRILEHLGITLAEREVNQIAARLFDPASPTFRRGRIGSWRTEMTAEHRRVFKQVAGDLLIDLGYETDLSW